MTELDRLIDEMLAAQSRFAVAWQDNKRPLTPQQIRDEQIRDEAKAKIKALFDANRSG